MGKAVEVPNCSNMTTQHNQKFCFFLNVSLQITQGNSTQNQNRKTNYSRHDCCQNESTVVWMTTYQQTSKILAKISRLAQQQAWKCRKTRSQHILLLDGSKPCSANEWGPWCMSVFSYAFISLTASPPLQLCLCLCWCSLASITLVHLSFWLLWTSTLVLLFLIQ